MKLFAKFEDANYLPLIFDAMSIFDEEDKIEGDSITNECKEVQLKKRKEFIRNKYVFLNQAGLSKQKFEEYCSNLSKVDVFHLPSVPGIPEFGKIRENVTVIFSSEGLTYSDKYGDDKLSEKDVLGEYKDYVNSKSYIYIYVNNIIKSCAPSDVNHLMLAVYIHELYHAYFKSGSLYNREVEEPLAEFGALFCLEAMASMRIINYSDVEYYRNEVGDKTDLLPEYALGGYIYDLLTDWKKGTLLELYKTAISDMQTIKIEVPSENFSYLYKQLCTALNYVD